MSVMADLATTTPNLGTTLAVGFGVGVGGYLWQKFKPTSTLSILIVLAAVVVLTVIAYMVGWLPFASAGPVATIIVAFGIGQLLRRFIASRRR